MLCAGKPGSVVSGCHGDSGGPYVCQNAAGRWVLQGAVSWGSGSCSASQMFTVFARVAKFKNWIDQHVASGELFGLLRSWCLCVGRGGEGRGGGDEERGGGFKHNFGHWYW